MDDGFKTFLDAAVKTPLLTAHQEKLLAQRIERGGPDGHRARQQLVEANIRLAVSQARKYQHSGVPFDDLVQEAIIGVDRAAQKFDWKTGNKFSTYAMWWIRHMLQRAVHKHRATIRIPGHIADRARRIDQYQREHHGASLEEAAEHVGITLEQAEEAMSTSRVVASLDQPLSDDEGGDRYALFADDNALDPADITTDANPQVSHSLAKLDDLHRTVIQLRFGFNGRPHSRDEVAEMLGVKPHVVQRAQRAALAQLERDLRGTISQEEGAA